MENAVVNSFTVNHLCFVINVLSVVKIIKCTPDTSFTLFFIPRSLQIINFPSNVKF